MTRLFRISYTDPSNKEQATQQTFKTKNMPLDLLIKVINAKSTIISVVSNNTRVCNEDTLKSRNLTLKEIHPWVRFDCDDPGEHHKIEVALEKLKLMYIKKPSTNYDTTPGRYYKFHFLIPCVWVPQNKKDYELMYYEFLDILKVQLKDNSQKIICQHQNPYLNGLDYLKGVQLTKVHQGNLYDPDKPKSVRQLVSIPTQRIWPQKSLQQVTQLPWFIEVKDSLAPGNHDMPLFRMVSILVKENVSHHQIISYIQSLNIQGHQSESYIKNKIKRVQ